ncbi:MAG: PRC-barrel domain-containing protein [Candidatus Micrarchaeota archaeon]
MAVKLSQLMGMDIYTDNAQYVGKVYDVILDLQKGEIARLTLEPIHVTSKEEAKRVFREKTVLYKSVKAVENIVIVGAQGHIGGEMDEAEPVSSEPAKPMPYSYRYKK